MLREKWLSGGEAADAVKPSQTEAGVITGRCSLLIPCEEVNRAGVAEKVIPAFTNQLMLHHKVFFYDYCACWCKNVDTVAYFSVFLSSFMVATIACYPGSSLNSFFFILITQLLLKTTRTFGHSRVLLHSCIWINLSSNWPQICLFSV